MRKIENKEMHKLLTCKIAQCNAQAERLDFELETIGVDDAETYLRKQRQRTGVILRLESLERRLCGHQPEWTHFAVATPQQVRI